MSASGPLDDTAYIAAGAHLFSYDNYFCLRELTPAAGCGDQPFTALDVLALPAAAPVLYAATASNVFLHPADASAPSCGAPLLTRDLTGRRAIAALRVSAAGLYFSDGLDGAIYFAPLQRGLATPAALVANGASSGFVGSRGGLALWGPDTLLYSASGAINGTRFQGLLSSSAATGAVAPGSFFGYSNAAWSAERLAMVGPGVLAWSERRPAEYAVQRTVLGAPPTGRGSVSPVVTGLPLQGTPLVSLAGDGRGQGTVWYAHGTLAEATTAGPVRGQPLFSLDLQALGLGGATGLAFAQGSPSCGYAFAYAAAGAPSLAPLFCAPRARAPASPLCAVLPAALLDSAARQAAWVVPVAVVLGLLAAAGVAWAAWAAVRARCCRGSGSGSGSGALHIAAVKAPSTGAYSFIAPSGAEEGGAALAAHGASAGEPEWYTADAVGEAPAPAAAAAAAPLAPAASGGGGRAGARKGKVG